MPPAAFTDLAAAYAWLDAQINYERNLGEISYTDRVFEVEAFAQRLAVLGSPHLGLSTVHIAGSRGKGSAAAAIDALLRASGLSTARYTSPHLHEYRERISLNGAMISPERFARLLARVAAAPAPDHEPRPATPAFKTVFEHLTALFFLAVRDAPADWSVVEVGLGGRLDATNVLPPGPVLLGRIALEHTHLLGNTLAEIAAEKAAILKPGGWAIAAPQATAPSAASEAGQVYLDRARQVGAELLWAADVCPLLQLHAHPAGLRLAYQFEGAPLELDLPIFGTYQAENLQNALAMLIELRRRGRVPRAERPALAAALNSLHIPGRMELLSRAPEILLDGAHCPAGAAALAQALDAHFGAEPAIAAVAMLADKDHAGFFRNLAAFKGWRELWVYPAHSPRASAPADLAAAARPWFPGVRVFDHIDQILEFIPKNADKLPRVIATGSLHSLGQWRAWGLGITHGSTFQSTTGAAQAEQGSGA